MKITKVTTLLLKTPLAEKRFYSSQCAFPERKSLLVRVDTDAGLQGWGECGQYGPGEPVAAFVHAVLAPRLLGRDPIDTSVLWEDMYCAIRDYARKGTGIEAISGLDIALWDLKGQFYKQPIHRLMGGAFRDRIRAYATGCYYKEEDFRDRKAALSALDAEATSIVNSGFSAIKGKIGLLSLEEDEERVRVIRQAVGPDTLLMMDCNHAYNAGVARRMGRILESLGVWFMEEPVVPEDLEGYAMLRSSLDIAIAGGEGEYTRHGFLEYFRRGCLDIAQPDLCCAGGITELKRIEALATAHHIQMIPHVWGSAVALAAALHLNATLAPTPHTAFPRSPLNEPMLEFDQSTNPLRDEVLVEPFQLDGDCVLVPQGPGLGIEIDQERLAEYLDSKTECSL